MQSRDGAARWLPDLPVLNTGCCGASEAGGAATTDLHAVVGLLRVDSVQSQKRASARHQALGARGGASFRATTPSDARLLDR